MQGKSLTSPLLTSNHAPWIVSTFAIFSSLSSYSEIHRNYLPFFWQHDVSTTTPSIASLNINIRSPNSIAIPQILKFPPKRKWVLKSTAQVETKTFTEEDKNSWEQCRAVLCCFNFSDEEADKILGKAYGQVRSPYWGEEREKVTPKVEIVKEILDYLKGLSLSDDDLSKVLKKFPEVLGCDLESELKNNVRILEKQWGIKGKPLRNLLLRNPKALGYNVDCKGDCIAQCTRCWARF